MKRKCLAAVIVLFFFGITTIQTIAQTIEKASQSTSNGNWLYVGGAGPGNYTHIQDALDNATSGDTIFVYSGSYYEDIVIKKSVTLQGRDKNTTTIEGAGDINDTVTINSDYARISGFTLKNDGPYVAYSVILFAQTNYSYIADNSFVGDDSDGALFSSIYMVGSNNNIISGNTFSKGVIRAWHHCNHNEISYNTLDSSTKGIIIFFSYYNTLTHNVINGAKDAAIIVSMSAHDDISYNTIRNCNSGLTLYAHDCNITYNNFIGVLKEAKIDSNDNFWVHNYWGRPRFLPKLIITASVFVTGSTTTDTFYGSLSPTLEIPLNVNLIDIQTPLTQSQSDKIEKTKTITLKTSNQQLIIYIITTVLSSILLALFLVLTKNKTQTTDELAKTVKKIRKKYGEWIVDIDNLPSSIDKQVLTVKTLDDLVKISEELGKPVMHYTSVTPNPGERHIFYVIDEDTHYKYVLTNE